MTEEYEESITVKISPDTKTEIRVSAAKEDLSMSEWLRQAIGEKLERDGESENRNPADPVVAD
jgi:predicted HicB family RNase H-like nuclease